MPIIKDFPASRNKVLWPARYTRGLRPPGPGKRPIKCIINVLSSGRHSLRHLTRCRHSGKRRAYLCCFDGRLASARTMPNESALSTDWRMSIECDRRSSEIRLLAPAFTEQRLADEATLQTQRGKIMVFDT